MKVYYVVNYAELTM